MSDRSSVSEARTVIIAPGVRVPYPVPTSDAATKVALGNRRKDTRPEVALRSELHRVGLRFRKDFLVVAGDARVKPDLVFTRAKVAVFVDRCFWHGCPEHQRIPRSNPEYWLPKLEANRTRDRRVNEALIAADWTVIRVWEHQHIDDAASRILAAVRRSYIVDGRPFES